MMRTEEITLAPTASGTPREHTPISRYSDGGCGYPMSSVRLWSAPNPAHAPLSPCSTSSFALSPETAIAAPGWPAIVQSGLMALLENTSTSIPPGCNMVSGGPHVIAFPLVVHGGDSSWLLKLPTRSPNELGITQGSPTLKLEGREIDT